VAKLIILLIQQVDMYDIKDYTQEEIEEFAQRYLTTLKKKDERYQKNKVLLRVKALKRYHDMKKS
jgi:hypothetical protein